MEPNVSDIDTTSDDELDIDNDDENGSTPPEGQPDAAKESRAAQQARKARLETAQLRRTLAFTKAGVDTDTKFGEFVMGSYKGDLDGEAIKAHVAAVRKELGVTDPPADDATPPATETKQYDPAETAQTDERRNLAAGGIPDDGTGINSRQQAIDAMKKTAEEGRVNLAPSEFLQRAVVDTLNGGDSFKVKTG